MTTGHSPRSGAAWRGVSGGLRAVPGGPRLLAVAQAEWARRTFRRSDEYWERHYARGGDSGGGSYGRLAEFKAEVLNDFVQTESVRSVVEWGCGDGNQLSFAKYPRYLGLDVSPTAIDRCLGRFEADETKSFIRIDPDRLRLRESALTADLALSLDVVYHLVETAALHAHLECVFSSAQRYAIIYAVDQDRPQVTPHVKFQRFTPWVQEHRRDWRQVRVVANRYPNEGDDLVGSDAAFHVFERRR